ncbi:hypothetical protein EDE05_112135 [Neorhizobium sp. R1-B]|nr:hypothetical protein EDE05_112135 [Neorhizobium sp. R1-B]
MLNSLGATYPKTQITRLEIACAEFARLGELLLMIPMSAAQGC